MTEETIKKKKRSSDYLFSRYKTYEGEPGSPEQWAAQAHAIIHFRSSNALSLLGLSQIPQDLDALKRARRAVMLTAHPDKGGDVQQAIRINEAYLALERLMALQTRPTAKPLKEPVGLVVPPRCTGTLPTNLNNPDYVWEEKVDGLRFKLYLGFDPYGRNRLPNTMLSRHKSTFDSCYMDRSGNVPHIANVQYPEHQGTVLDGEAFLIDLTTTASIMGSTESEAEDKQRIHGKMDYLAFDISFHRGQDVRNLPYDERRALLIRVVAELDNPNIRVAIQIKGDIEAAFKRFTDAGLEGFVGKKKKSRYGEGWVKLKKSYSVSCVITGYRPGAKALKDQIGSLALSIYRDGKLVEVGFASGMTNAERIDMTDHFDRYLGQVVDVFCMELTKDGKLRNPTYHCVRNDVNADECTYEKLKDDMSKVRQNRSKT